MKSDLATAFSSAEASPGFLLWQITNQWQSKQRAALAPFDITHVQFVLLASLVWDSTSDGISQKQLAKRAKTDTMMTSQVLRTLEKKDLLVRRVSPNDKRAILVFPTSKGIALASKAVRVVEQVDADFFGILGAKTASLTSMMQTLVTQ